MQRRDLGDRRRVPAAVVGLDVGHQSIAAGPAHRPIDSYAVVLVDEVGRLAADQRAGHLLEADRPRPAP
jgi:hypothetical protein